MSRVEDELAEKAEHILGRLMAEPGLNQSTILINLLPCGQPMMILMP